MSNLNRLPLEVNNLAISFIYLYQYFAFSVSQDDAITIQEWCTSSVDVGGGKIPMCLFGPSSLSSFLAIFSCVGVRRNVKKSSAGSWDMHWKEREESLWSFFPGQPMELWHFCLYWCYPTSSRLCDEKED